MKQASLYTFILTVLIAFASVLGILQYRSSQDYMMQLGTAWFVNTEGYLVTAEHVVSGAHDFFITYKKHTYDATVVARDKKHDIAVIKTSIKDDVPIPLDLTVVKRAPVVLMGFPDPEVYGWTLKYSKGTARTGGVFDTTIYASLAICPGNSGGPIVRTTGNSLGLITDNYEFYYYNKYECSTEGFGTASLYIAKLLSDNHINFTINEDKKELGVQEVITKYNQSVVLIEGVCNVQSHRNYECRLSNTRR